MFGRWFLLECLWMGICSRLRPVQASEERSEIGSNSGAGKKRSRTELPIAKRSCVRDCAQHPIPRNPQQLPITTNAQKLLLLCAAQSAADSSPAFRLWMKSMELFCGESSYCLSSAARALTTANDAGVLSVNVVDTNSTVGLSMDIAEGSNAPSTMGTQTTKQAGGKLHLGTKITAHSILLVPKFNATDHHPRGAKPRSGSGCSARGGWAGSSTTGRVRWTRTELSSPAPTDLSVKGISGGFGAGYNMGQPTSSTNEKPSRTRKQEERSPRRRDGERDESSAERLMARGRRLRSLSPMEKRDSCAPPPRERQVNQLEKKVINFRTETLRLAPPSGLGLAVQLRCLKNGEDRQGKGTRAPVTWSEKTKVWLKQKRFEQIAARIKAAEYQERRQRAIEYAARRFGCQHLLVDPCYA